MTQSLEECRMINAIRTVPLVTPQVSLDKRMVEAIEVYKKADFWVSEGKIILPSHIIDFTETPTQLLHRPQS